MTDQSKGKGVFDNLVNAVSSRDEKAALEAAKQQITGLEQKVAAAEQRATANGQHADVAEHKVSELQGALSKSQADSQALLVKTRADFQAQLTKTQADLQAANASLMDFQQRAIAAEAKAKSFEYEKDRLQQQAAALEAAKAKFLGSHTIAKDETLSHISLKYYGHATEPYWRVIYEANKGVIGTNPNIVRPGMVISIPVLPDSLKK